MGDHITETQEAIPLYLLRTTVLDFASDLCDSCLAGFVPQGVGFPAPNKQVGLLHLFNDSIVVCEFNAESEEIRAVGGIGTFHFRPKVAVIVQCGYAENLDDRGRGVCTAKQEEEGEQQCRDLNESGCFHKVNVAFLAWYGWSGNSTGQNIFSGSPSPSWSCRQIHVARHLHRPTMG